MSNRALNRKYNWAVYGISVGILHVLGFILLLGNAHNSPTLVGMGMLAYTLGLRHAFDADHIAAIDNTVRKLVQEDRNPVGVGFFFSLGHSTVVCIMALVTAFSVEWAQKHIPQLQTIGSFIGTLVSGAFLVLLGVLNLFILVSIYKVFLQLRKSEYDENKFEELLHTRGLIARFISPLLKMISRSWHVYPIGFLFGLGFDTASEVALLAISAGAGKSALPLSGLIALPILFAAGMSLLDTADGVFMTTAYDWAFATPVRKIYYNLTVTGLAVVAALLIGVIELAQVLTPQVGLTQGIWKWLQDLNFGSLGYLLVILFVATWALSYAAWKIFRIEQRWTNGV
ncbi:MAG: high-affinity nickel-transporter, HoxN/HupN/NixA family [Bacilli bacterium]|nr:high-affinity nickel-transporter, HoxN/HupN/NixA family [Bacilli bacterium]